LEEWERLLEDLRAEFLLREEELELLHAIDLHILRSEESLDKTFEFILSRTQALLNADHAHILLTRGRFLLPTYSSLDSDLGQRIEVGSSITGQCVTANATVTVGDLRDPEYADRYISIAGYSGPPMLSLLATPIKVNETMVGVLNVESTRLHAFKPVHAQAIGAIAAQVAIALQRAQLFDQAELFSSVDSLMFEDNDTQQVIQTALQGVMSALQRLEHVSLSGAQILFRKGTEELEIVHSTNSADVDVVLNIQDSICGRAVSERRTIVIGDVSKDPKYRRMLGSKIQSEIAVPILLGDSNLVIGVLNVESEEIDAFNGFYQIMINRFADKVRTLLAFAKLRSDVTEAMELRNTNDLLIAVGDQSSHMIHRVNNTVGSMRYRIMELQRKLRQGALSDDFLEESIAALLKSANRTLRMPTEVSRILSGEGRVLDVNECVHRAVDEIQVPASIDLVLNLQEDLPRVSLYNFDIVVQNLVQNSIDSMKNGGRLELESSAVFHEGITPGFVQVAVSDTGAGIPADVLPNIFDLSFTTKTGHSKGLGLGLWWIRHFVKRAKGDISVESEPGMGTRFVVRIPVSRAPTSEATEPGAVGNEVPSGGEQ
jgi:signal transduction histidine kinase